MTPPYDPASAYPDDEWTAETVGSTPGTDQHNSPASTLPLEDA